MVYQLQSVEIAQLKQFISNYINLDFGDYQAPPRKLPGKLEKKSLEPDELRHYGDRNPWNSQSDRGNVRG
jgi:hypothetical protein